MSKSIYISKKHICKECNKEFKTLAALKGHLRTHNTTSKIFKCPECEKEFNKLSSLNSHKSSHRNHYITCSTCNGDVISYNFQKHLDRRKKCLNCNELFCKGISRIKGKKRFSSKEKFCSSSCSSLYYAESKSGHTEETKNKIKNIMKTKYMEETTVLERMLNVRFSKYAEEFIVGSYTRVYSRTCFHCNENFLSRGKTKYCKKHKHLYTRNNRTRYVFSFNIYHYPDLFDLDLLNEHGWYSPGGKSGTPNMNGLTRDHKVSVNEAIKNNYDPYYIKHPLNCRLMNFSENYRKGTNSSLSYNKLIEIVDKYDMEK